MGPKTALGAALAVVAFLLAGTAWYMIFGMGLSFWVALAAGGFTFKYFYDLDQKGLAQLLSPPVEVWPVSYPIAWGCICDVLRRSGIDTGTSGRSVWTIMQEDDSRGFIQAKLAFNEMQGVGQRSQIVPREIHLSVQLAAEGSATRVKFLYEILSPMGAGMVRKLIAKNQEDFRAHVEVNKIK
ncbi:MAG: hypothetical protein C0473_00420 [Cyanobacteria bacterium DS3.002]|nr:hypothetical protein [Cyanobacteria bacterium DS3.002]MBA4050093.1 hypothetical protein [Cyanobacteria bacterium DS2.008]MBA4075229.1 hypothetical protein [Cyanobacteria bacterium PR.023]